MPDAPQLAITSLTVKRGRRTTLRDVTLHAQCGEILAVLGPNGAGKSTLLQALSGLIAYSGHVHLEGAPIDSLTPRERARRLSLVPQQSRLAAAMPVVDVVRQGRYAHCATLGRFRPEDDAAVERAMRETDIVALSGRFFDELSFGEQKRVLIARALCTGARTLLLDEPTASLDIEHALRLFVLLRELANQGRCIVVVLHHLDEARRYADRAALIKDGRVMACGPSREVISADRVRALYNVELVEGGGLGFRLPVSTP